MLAVLRSKIKGLVKKPATTTVPKSDFGAKAISSSTPSEFIRNSSGVPPQSSNTTELNARNHMSNFESSISSPASVGNGDMPARDNSAFPFSSEKVGSRRKGRAPAVPLLKPVEKLSSEESSEVSIATLQGGRHIARSHYKWRETLSSTRVRQIILGYRTAKLTPALLKTYCAAHNLEYSNSVEELTEGVQHHVKNVSPRYVVFALGWDIQSSTQTPASTAPLNGLIKASSPQKFALFHVQSQEHRVFKPSNKKDVEDVRSWIQKKCVSIGPMACAALLPMYSDPHVEDICKLFKCHLLQDSMALCSSAFFEHVGRIKGLRMPRTLKDAYFMICSSSFQCKESQPEISNAILAWETCKVTLRHLGGKSSPEEQMLSSLRGIFDINFVSYKVGADKSGKTVFKYHMFSICTHASLKIEASSLSEIVQQLSTHFDTAFRLHVLLIPCQGTKLSDLEQLAHSNRNKIIRLHALSHSSLMQSQVSLEEEPKLAWKGVATMFGGEPPALSTFLNLALRHLQSVTMRMDSTHESQDQYSPSPTSTPGKFVEVPEPPNPKTFTVLSKGFVDISTKLELTKYYKTFDTSDRQVREACVSLRHANYLVLDLETTTKKFHKRIASPFCDQNRVVLPGYLDFNGNLTIPEEKLQHREDMKLPPLDEYDVIVGHNLKFDLLWLWKDPELRRFLRRGGRVWDTMYAEYLLSGQRVRVGTGAGLNEVAVRYGGTRKLDAIKAMWDRGVDTADIDTNLLREYLEGDLRNTERIFRRQLEIAVANKQALVIEARMDIVPCTTEMEFNGLKMDRLEGKRQYDALRLVIAQQKAGLKKLIPPEVPLLFHQHFNWASNQVLSALYYGGKAKVAEPSMLGTPLNVTAAVELCVLANKFSGAAAKKYSIPYLKSQGLRTSGTKDNVQERLKAFVSKKATYNFRVILCGGFAENKPWLYEPLKPTSRNSETHYTEEHYSVPNTEGKDTGEINLESLCQGGDGERVLFISFDEAELEILSYFERHNIFHDDRKSFFCRAVELYKGGPYQKPIDCTDFWTLLKKVVFTSINSEGNDVAQREVLQNLLYCIGSSVGTSYDCFAHEVDKDVDTVVSFPGKLEQYFSDRNERAKFLEKAKTEKGNQSVNIEVMEVFAAKGEAIAKLLLELRGNTKLLSTYYEMDGTGMMSLLNDRDDCIHHELSLCHTTTSRMASANPNMQNVPKTTELRNLFVSRFGEEGSMLEADYSQLEVVVMCALSKDPQMTQDLLNKVDFHCKRVTMMKPGLSYEEVLQKAKKEKIPEFVELRQRAKIFSFQRQYGAGVTKLSESTGLSFDEVKSLIQNEESMYYKVKRFYDLVAHAVNSWNPSLQDGSRTETGNCAYKGEFRVLTGTRFTFGEIERAAFANSRFSDTNLMSFLSTQLKNYPVQGFAGEIVQVMMGRLWRHFLETENYNNMAFLTNTVHDCVWVDCHKSVVHEVAGNVSRILNNVREVFNEKWPELELEVSFGTETVVGKTMANMKALE